MKKLLKKLMRKLILILLKIYFLPAIIALKSEHEKVERIAAINMIVGWTIIGWLLLCVYAIDQVKVYE